MAEKTDEPEKKKRPEGILVVKGDSEKADAALHEGGIEATFFIESHGNDKDTVAEALKKTILTDLKKEGGITLRVMKFHPVIENEDMYSGFVECSFVARDPQKLIFLALRYGPAAIEVVKPDNITLSKAELQNIAADSSAAVQALVGKLLHQMKPEERTKALKDGLEL